MREFGQVAGFFLFTDYHYVATFFYHVCCDIGTFCQHKADDIASFQQGFVAYSFRRGDIESFCLDIFLIEVGY